MSQTQLAKDFAALHEPGAPLILYNIWDAGSAKVIAENGAAAIATGSWSVAAAHGFDDGQSIPLDLVVQIVSRIVATVDLPVTLDFEGGYAETSEGLAANIARALDAGVVGINFEDQVLGGSGLYSIDSQCKRIGAIRHAADLTGVPLFINARTDLFLKQSDRAKHATLKAEALERAEAYHEAGASGLFVPGLVEPGLVESVCSSVSLPVNVMMIDGAPPVDVLASAGVARVSYGPGPYFHAAAALADRFRVLAGGVAE